MQNRLCRFYADVYSVHISVSLRLCYLRLLWGAVYTEEVVWIWTRESKELEGERWRRDESDRLIYFSVLFGAFFLSLALSPTFPLNLCGHCWREEEEEGGAWRLTGACSNTIPVTRGEEWPPFPLGSLSFPSRPTVLPVCVAWYQETFKRASQTPNTMCRDETDAWRMRPEVPLTSLPPTVWAEVWLWVYRRQCQKPLSCNEVRERDGLRHGEDTDKVLSVCSEAWTPLFGWLQR